jgi:hypothetical protein
MVISHEPIDTMKETNGMTGFSGGMYQANYTDEEETIMEDKTVEPAEFMSVRFNATYGSYEDPEFHTEEGAKSENEVLNLCRETVEGWGEGDEDEIYVYQLVKIVRPRRIIVETEIVDFKAPNLPILIQDKKQLVDV